MHAILTYKFCLFVLLGDILSISRFLEYIFLSCICCLHIFPAVGEDVMPMETTLTVCNNVAKTAEVGFAYPIAK